MTKSDPHTLILSSGSKTRQQMLRNAGVPFEVYVPKVDETAIKQSLIEEKVAARDIADALADAKANSASFMYPNRMILAADQILVFKEKILSKAQTRDEAKETLMLLSGGTHSLVSAAVVYDQGQPVWRQVATAEMKVRPLTDPFIDWYLDTLGNDAFWSVGAYQLEGIGAQLFDQVDGDYFTVLGLPLIPVLDFLRRRNILKL